jgi:hypothetical protein
MLAGSEVSRILKKSLVVTSYYVNRADQFPVDFRLWYQFQVKKMNVVRSPVITNAGSPTWWVKAPAPAMIVRNYTTGGGKTKAVIAMECLPAVAARVSDGVGTRQRIEDETKLCPPAIVGVGRGAKAKTVIN